MVRLEKIAYEQLFNIKALGRARVITTPRKWHSVNPNEQAEINSIRWANSLLGRIIRPFADWFHQYELRWQRDLFAQQGLAFEDKFLHEEAELRRDNFFEHMARENLHPYHYVLKTKRRERYYKVERAVRGFFVPNHVRAEAEEQTLTTALKLKEEWDQFTHNNYYSDMTPFARPSVIPKIIPLELPLLYGVLSQEAWDQYFYNEKNTMYFTEKELAVYRDKKKYPYDLTTPEGKAQFEEWLNNFISRNPGITVPVGQKFDFKAHYTRLGV